MPVVPENEVLEYSQTGTLLNTFTGTGEGALKGPTGVAVDYAGNLWVADSGNNRIEELSPADVPLGEIKSEGVEDAIALDGHGDVFAIVKNSAIAARYNRRALTWWSTALRARRSPTSAPAPSKAVADSACTRWWR